MSLFITSTDVSRNLAEAKTHIHADCTSMSIITTKTLHHLSATFRGEFRARRGFIRACRAFSTAKRSNYLDIDIELINAAKVRLLPKAVGQTITTHLEESHRGWVLCAGSSRALLEL
ncbi:hypothetical protein RRF57_010260 [Xylaria bambusicola]|uniref:Uncharacterized protein n=1 Tax=Xylaria bambusicola TaxID=326684 RepID=A0AAN7Z8E7_9PEZI